MSEIYSNVVKCFAYLNILIELSNGKKLTGYEIVANVKNFGFEVSPGTTYHHLDMLLREGMIRVEKRPWGKTNKKVYEMTENGRNAFEEFKKKWRKPLEYVRQNLYM